MPESTERLDALREAIATIGQSRSIRVLLVEDDPQEQELIKLEMGKYPLTVESSNSGESALAKLTSAKFDIIFLDVKLPGMDGIATFREIKRNWPDSRVFFVTGYPEFHGLNAALEMGVIRVIEKGVLPTALKELFAPLCKPPR